MNDKPPTFTELLEANHHFPGPYMFKVIGKPADGFIGRVLGAVRKELNADIDPPFTLRQSSKGQYVALTIEPYIMRVEEVLAIYACLKDVDGIVTYC